ncbi:SCO family protein [Kingella negevensis]|uniref:Thioredoxin domain-containing protein n=1 Tax=Kingella negevensis TaxID=1522312 RepID=A0A238TCK7_9NEIS|nr:SCO family protein [Kingella negevensis]MDK4679918.1 SCO family protein [Kingella negevensis]MDK4682363.1 SCO family protein [Kingella negevensis]MDK4685298.1 SCO family protein [Kingella negevensis]MDK4690560.1 SCO family protein [Kingella negevensis]MDK4692092.1 SCO family protein [Kingella negevensis]
MKKVFLSVLTALALTACGQQNNNEVSSIASQVQQEIKAESADNAPTASAPVAASAPAIIGLDIRKDNLGGDFTLTGSDGKPFTLSSLKGKVVILSFGYTNCPDVCPTELLTYKDVLAQLGDKAKDVAVVFVSVDPERDTPEVVGKYVQQFHPSFIGLTDTTKGRDLAVIKQLYEVVSAKSAIQSDTVYVVDHSSGTFLLDKTGKPAYMERYGMEAPQIAADVEKLLSE